MQRKVTEEKIIREGKLGFILFNNSDLRKRVKIGMKTAKNTENDPARITELECGKN